MAWPTGVGAIVAVIVLILCVLGAVGVLPADPRLVYALIGAVAVCRLL